LVRDTRRPTLLAEDAVRCLSTSRRRLALPALIPMLRPDHVRLYLIPLLAFHSHEIDGRCIFFSFISDEWSVKAKRRKTTGTGRMSYLKTIPRKFKNGFREGNVFISNDSYELWKYFKRTLFISIFVQAPPPRLSPNKQSNMKLKPSYL
jgi:hypothetical protein